MENVNIILKILGSVIISVGVVLMFDARKLTEKYIKKSDINDITKKLKIAGFIALIIGCVIFFL